jgi:hypothetical protein
VVERVCKRVRRLTNSDDFWVRHPYICRYYPRRRTSFGASTTPRRIAFTRQGVRMIRKYQKVVHHNAFLGILGDDGEDCVADSFRTLSPDILSRMNHIGPEAHFRLRGDAIGYICELLQGFMVSRLDMAMYLAIHKIGFTPSDYAVARGNSTKCTVQRDDIALAFQKDMFSPFFCGHSPLNSTRCNVAKGNHGKGLADDCCSCSLPSSSGIVWRWPLDDCRGVLPPEAGRRIIRGLAYQSGILQMSNEAFILAEAELLHMLGVLLVCAYESSVEMAKTTQLLGEEDEIAYNEPTDSLDMFKFPPPPFQNEHLVYTIVPGQIRTAAEERDITPSNVYGDVWVSSSGFTKEEEDEIERSYYYQSISSSDNEEEEDDDDDEYSDSDSDILNWKYERIGSKAKVEDDLDDWSVCNTVEDSEMDMDDYEEDSYLAEYHHGRDEVEAHYNHFPPNPNNEEDDEDNNDEDMAVDNDA